MDDSHATPNLPSMVLSERTELSFPSFPHWIEALVEYLRQKAILSGACEETRARKLMLALHEAFSNAIVHGNLEVSSELKEHDDNSFAEALAQRAADPNYSRRTVEIVIDCEAERCRWIITNEGPGFDVDAVMKKKASDDPEVVLASGRGMLIMSSFLDGMAYEMGGRRLVLTLRRESGAEKRRRERVPSVQAVQVVPILPDGAVDWDAAYAAVSRDFSHGGMALLQSQLSGTERILLGVNVENRLIYIPAEVRHCRSLGSDMVELGCRFQAKSEAAEPATAAPADLARVQQAIAELLQRQSIAPLPADERRAYQRAVYNERIEVVPAGQSVPLVGYARDLSKGGVAFISATRIATDSISIVLPQAATESMRIRARVVRCVRIQEGFFDVAAQFLGLDG